MTLPKLCVLGGSTPFTAGLIDAISQDDSFEPAMQLTIHGRHEARVKLIADYAMHWLSPRGWRVNGQTSVEAVLDGADIVIHQIRYGDLEGRAAGERLCKALGLPADETLGPAALLTAIQSQPAISQTCEALLRYCPAARVVNLTNPLSAVTAAMLCAGVKGCIGLCELPLVTMRQAAERLQVNSRDVSWTYSGLNHRGFIDSFVCQGRDLIHDLAGQLGDATLGGVTASEIKELQAIPLKYFRLMSATSSTTYGRAQSLAVLRDQVTKELEASIEAIPPSLSERYMAWYPDSVVPMLRALLSDTPTTQVVNIEHSSGLVVETKAQVCCNRIEPNFHETGNRQVLPWNDRFFDHERKFIRAMFDPSDANLKTVLEADPIVPSANVSQAVQALSRSLENSR